METLQCTIDLEEDWLDKSETEPELQECLLESARGRGGTTMEEVCWGHNKEYHQLGKEQDEIGWRGFIEGITCKQARLIQTLYHYSAGMKVAPEKWTMGLALKLLEVMHGQWLYQNVQINEETAGSRATLRK